MGSRRNLDFNFHMNGSPSFQLSLRPIFCARSLSIGALETHSAFLRGQTTIVPKYNTFLVTNPTKLRPFNGRSVVLYGPFMQPAAPCSSHRTSQPCKQPRSSFVPGLKSDYTCCSNMLRFITLRRALSLLLILTPLARLARRPALAQAQSDQTVYTDALVNGWQNWSWATVNLSNTAPVQSGADSISVSAGPYQALYLSSSPIDSTSYASLVFWINGGPTGGQLLQVQATLNGTAQTVVTLPALAANTWQQVTLPLSSLGVQNQPDLDGFWIQDRSGTTQSTFFVDTISIKAQSAPSVVT